MMFGNNICHSVVSEECLDDRIARFRGIGLQELLLWGFWGMESTYLGHVPRHRAIHRN